jgi:hypothetical protein
LNTDAAERAAQQVHFDDAAQRLLVQLVRACEPDDSGIVEQSVECAELLHAPPDQPGRVIPRRHVGHVTDGSAAGRHDVRDNGLDHIGVDVVDDHLRAQPGRITGTGRASHHHG